jgi:hypothetical protein
LRIGTWTVVVLSNTQSLKNAWKQSKEQLLLKVCLVLVPISSKRRSSARESACSRVLRSFFEAAAPAFFWSTCAFSTPSAWSLNGDESYNKFSVWVSLSRLSAFDLAADNESPNAASVWASLSRVCTFGVTVDGESPNAASSV